LINSKSDLNAKEEHGKTPLHIVCEKNFPTVIDILLKRGANIEAADKDGKTALYMAVLNGEIPVHMLICAKCDLNVRDNFFLVEHCDDGLPRIPLAKGNSNPS